MNDRHSILHVDKDPQSLRLVAEHLRLREIEVISIDSTGDPVAQLISGHCRVVLLDIDLPGINGLDLLRCIKRADGAIQVI